VGFCVCAALLVACGGSRVTDVYAALDSGGLRQRTQFYTDTVSIFCVAQVAGASAGTTVNAKIRETATPSGAADVLLAVGEDVVSSSAPDTIAFELTKPPDNPDGPWPVGKFECDIQLDGVQEGSTTFDILMPRCPVYPVAAGDVCAGYYPVGAVCASADQTKGCLCDPTGVWKC
jgi:hypothetical protein